MSSPIKLTACKNFAQQLIDAGVIPPNCRNFTLTLTPLQPITAKYEVFITQEQMEAIEAAAKDLNDEELLRKYVLRTRDGSREKELTIEPKTASEAEQSNES